MSFMSWNTGMTAKIILALEHASFNNTQYLQDDSPGGGSANPRMGSAAVISSARSSE